jgi:hypothetical protein
LCQRKAVRGATMNKKKNTILVVDPDPQIQKMMTIVLDEADFTLKLLLKTSRFACPFCWSDLLLQI